jgi:hypothetical protein
VPKSLSGAKDVRCAHAAGGRVCGRDYRRTLLARLFVLCTRQSQLHSVVSGEGASQGRPGDPGRLMTTHSMPRTASEPSLAAWLYSYCPTASLDRLSAVLSADRELCRVLEAVEQKHRLDQDAALETEKSALNKVRTTRRVLSDSRRAARVPFRDVGRGLFGDGAVLPSRRLAY